MSIEMVRAVLLWCTVINAGLLLWWGLLFTLAHDWLHPITSRRFRLSVEQFDAINYAGIVILKTCVLSDERANELRILELALQATATAGPLLAPSSARFGGPASFRSERVSSSERGQYSICTTSWSWRALRVSTTSP